MIDLKQIYIYNKEFPIEVFQEVCSHYDVYKAELVKGLEYVVGNPNNEKYQDFMIHLYSLSIFAQHESRDVFPTIKTLLELDNESLDSLFGDALEGFLDKIIYRTFNDDHEWMSKMLYSDSVDMFIKNCLLKGYVAYLLDYKKDEKHFHHFMSKLIEDRAQLKDILDFLRDVITERHLFEYIEAVQLMYDEHLMNELYDDLFDSFIDSIYNYHRKLSISEPLEAIELFRDWHCFEESFRDFPLSDLEKMKKEQRLQDILRLQHLYQPYEPEMRITTKVGRNEPCPCGSGKKYKKCCINKNSANDMSFIETEKKQWLKSYPSNDVEAEVYLTDHFDSEAIEIDKYLYLALHHREIPIYVERDGKEEHRRKMIYLNLAKEMIDKKIEREGLSSYIEYDKKHKIHYRISDWLKLVE